MNTYHWFVRFLAGMGMISFLAGCNLGSAPLPTIDTQPTLVAVKTQSAQTVVAGLTQSAPAATATRPVPTAPPPSATAPEPTATLTLPAVTPLPTLTMTPTLKPSPTAVIWTRTATSSAWSCTFTEFLPKINQTFNPREDFDGHWTIKNTGTEKWYSADIDVRYVSGVKFQTRVDSVDLPNDVNPDGEVTIIIDMLAPSDPGRYTAIWEMATSSRAICTWGITLYVR